MPKYFDVHSHLNFSSHWRDFNDVLKRLKESETYTIAVGTDLESSRKAVELAEKHEEIYASIGIHPVDNPSESFDKLEFEKLVGHPKVVLIGECGLDFFHAEKDADYTRQEKLFLDQLNFAIVHNKPLMIHSRNAYSELLEILEPLKAKHGPKLRGNIHFFAGDVETARRFFELGFTLSFTGVITFARDYDEVIRLAPIEKIMSETDSPYVAPVPHRGKTNEPSYVLETVKKIAEIRNEDFETVRAALVNNALSMIR